MAEFLTIPVGVFLLLWGLLWQPKAKADEEDLAEILTEEEQKLDPGELRKLLRLIAFRIVMLIIGVICIVGGFIQGLGDLQDWSAFGVFVAVYGGSILVLQRAEKSSKLIVFFTMALVGYFAWRFADYRGLASEHDWGLLLAAVLNFVFWLAVGRHFTPEDKIEVLT